MQCFLQFIELKEYFSSSEWEEFDDDEKVSNLSLLDNYKSMVAYGIFHIILASSLLYCYTNLSIRINFQITVYFYSRERKQIYKKYS